MRAVVLAAVIVLFCWGSAAVLAQSSPIKFPDAAVVYSFPANVQQTMIYRPTDGSGPFPAVVLMHQCGGNHVGMFA